MDKNFNDSNYFFSKSRHTGQLGAQLVTLVFFTLIFFMLAALAVGIGLVGVNSVRTNTSNDSAALSALETYSKEPSALATPQVDKQTAQQRADSALSTANSVLGNLKTVTGDGNTNSQNSLSHYNNGSSSNYLQFGQWIVGPPVNATPGGPDTCTSDYPCLKLNNSIPADPGKVTAVKIVKKSSGVQQALDYFSRIAFGTPVLNQDKTIESTAVIIPRCYVYALDVSVFSVWDTHHAAMDKYLDTQIIDKRTIIDPQNPSLFAYDSGLLTAKSYDPDFYVDEEQNQLYWANMEVHRPNSGALPGSHYRSDFSFTVSNSRGTHHVDTVTDPQPLTNLLGALNGAVREHARNLTSSDKALMLVFDHNIYDRVPNSGFFDVDHDLRFLSQLTNYKNYKDGVTINGRTPNFVTRGWYPVADGFTMHYPNMPLALRRSIEELKGMCPNGSERKIIVVTPGIINAGYDSNGTPIPFETYNEYRDFENNVILGSQSSEDTGNIFTGSILEDAKKFDIKISFIYSGTTIRPNFCNRSLGGGQYVSIFNARREGFLSIANSTCSGQAQTFFETISVFTPPLRSPHTDCASGDDSCSWTYVGTTTSGTILHGRANYLMGQLAFETGGKMCPILPQASSGYSGSSPGKLSNRTASPQQYSITDMSTGNIGSECFNETAKGRRTSLIQTSL